MTTGERTGWRRVGLALITLIVFLQIDNLKYPFAWIGILALLPKAVGVIVWKLAGVILCVVAVAVIERSGVRRSLASLGMIAPVGRAFAVAFLGTLPMLVVYGLASRFSVHLSLAVAIRTAVAAPLAEEVLYRGYFFGQLHRKVGVPFLPAALITAVPFALGHLYQATNAGFGLMGTIGVLLVTGFGSVYFAWVFVRWDDNLWVAVFLHAFMNLWWDFFGMDTTALGGGLANGARFASIGVVIALTLSRWAAGRARLARGP